METRERYIHAAIALLREGGYARAGINEIVAASGAAASAPGWRSPRTSSRLR